MERAISLYTHHGSYTKEGSELYTKSRNLIENIIKDFLDCGFSRGDIEAIIYDAISMAAAYQSTKRGIQIIKEERSQLSFDFGEHPAG